MSGADVIDFVSHPVRILAALERAARHERLFDRVMAIVRDPYFDRIGREAVAHFDFTPRD
jgi:hypothetical protein